MKLYYIFLKKTSLLFLSHLYPSLLSTILKLLVLSQSLTPVIFRHILIITDTFNIIQICNFRIFSTKYRTYPTHITICNTRKSIFYKLSAFFFCRSFYFWCLHFCIYRTIPVLLRYSSFSSRNSFSPLIYGS